MKRAVLVQLLLFGAIAVGCAIFVANTVLGPQALAAPIRVTAHMADAAGLAPTSQVTYRGVRVGTVSDVAIDESGSGARLELSLDPGVQVPSSARAVISMDTPMGIQHLDLQADADEGPYLRNGSVIERENTGRPLPLETLLVHFAEVADSIDGRDISVLSESLATGLNGAEPELQRIMDNTEALAELAEQHEPRITNLLEQGPELLDSAEGTAGDLPEVARSMRELTGDLRQQEPAVRELAHNAPEVTRELVRLLDENDQATGALLGNLVSTGQVVSARAPAVDEAMTAVPRGLGDLASIVHGDVADFYLVGSQGPVCYYDTPRRTAQETGPRELRTEWTCPAGVGRQQRGADSAPRPNEEASNPTTPHDPAINQVAGSPESRTPVSAADRSPVLGPRSWYSIMLQGVR